VRTTILSLLILISLAATVQAYSFIESAANMIEMLLSPFFTSDPTDGGAHWLGGPFLVLFIIVGAARFIGVPLVASAVAGGLGGWGLRQSKRSLSRRAGWICSAFAAVCATALVIAIIQPDVFVTDRPRMKPKTPRSILAGLAGANAALCVFVGTVVLRRAALRGPSRPPPLPSTTNVA
jgi:hypothetical protein